MHKAPPSARSGRFRRDGAPPGPEPSREPATLRLLLGVLVLALLALAALAGESRAQGTSEDENVLVRFAPGTDPAERAAAREAADAEFEKTLPLRGLQVIDPRPGRSTDDVVERLERSADVLYAEPDVTRSAFAYPNDPWADELWGLFNSGQSINGHTGGTADADIDATEAWDLTTGTAAVTVGILDTGVDYAHPDLAPNIWVNPGESGAGRETNGIDDDANGYVDDWHGWDWSGNNASAPDDNDPADENWHGTHVAGTVGARGNDGSGAAGVAWHVSLVPLRVLNSAGEGKVSDLIAGYGYARQKGLRIVNASLGGTSSSPAERDALAAAPNTLFIVAAGNGGSDLKGDNNDVTGTYPCSYDLPNVICVAATDGNDRLASFSNYGRTSVDLAAPGVQILSTIPSSDRGLGRRHVDGHPPRERRRCARVVALNPGATVAQVRSALLSTVDIKPSLADKTVTGGASTFSAHSHSPRATRPTTLGRSPGRLAPHPPAAARPRHPARRRCVVAARGRLRLRSGVRLRTRCSEACGLRHELVLGARTARRLGLGRLHWIVGRVRGRLGRAGAVTIRLKLTAQRAPAPQAHRGPAAPASDPGSGPGRERPGGPPLDQAVHPASACRRWQPLRSPSVRGSPTWMSASATSAAGSPSATRRSATPPIRRSCSSWASACRWSAGTRTSARSWRDAASTSCASTTATPAARRTSRAARPRCASCSPAASPPTSTPWRTWRRTRRVSSASSTWRRHTWSAHRWAA